MHITFLMQVAVSDPTRAARKLGYASKAVKVVQPLYQVAVPAELITILNAAN
jgi:hypothetical protein